MPVEQASCGRKLGLCLVAAVFGAETQGGCSVYPMSVLEIREED